MTAVIVCNGSIIDYSYYKKYLENDRLIISVDGGAAHIRQFGIIPHIVLGDFDSISKEDFEYFKNAGAEIIQFQVEKDMTDTELALKTAIERGYREIVIIGGLGHRLDHSLANVFILKKILEWGAKGVIVNEHNEITLIDRSIRIEKKENTKLTLLALSEKVTGVTIKGFYYPLNNATLEMGSTWGVSNEFVNEWAEVSIDSGLLLVIQSRD